MWKLGGTKSLFIASRGKAFWDYCQARAPSRFCLFHNHGAVDE